MLIKTTGALMIEQTAKDLAYPTMTCPLTGKRITAEDVMELIPAHSGKSACGGAEARIHKPTMN